MLPLDLELFDSRVDPLLYYDLLHCDKIRLKEVNEHVESLNMSVVVGLIGNNGIVLATDSQRTKRNYRIKVTKLWALTPNIGIMTFGYHGGYRQFLINLWKEKKAHIDNIGYQSVDMFASEVKENIAKYFGSKSKYKPLEVLKLAGEGFDFVLAGYDVQNNPHIMSVSSMSQVPFIPEECTPCHIDGIKDIGIYWSKKTGVDDMITNHQLSCDFLKKFAVMIILETIVFSDIVCEPIQLAVIDEKGYQDKSAEVESIKQELDSKQQWLYNALKSMSIS
ncbi:hypothetical protein ACFLVK_02195 [Chloroflexota bacterium]